MKVAVEGLGDEQDWGVWCEIFKESIKNYVWKKEDKKVGYTLVEKKIRGLSGGGMGIREDNGWI